jgi:hypothetical protein
MPQFETCGAEARVGLSLGVVRDRNGGIYDIGAGGVTH